MCVQIIRVDDTTPPNAPNPPADVNVQCASQVPPPVDLTASNNCNGGDITVSPSAVITPGNCNNQFTMVRTWTFIDGCGNQSSVSQTINVNDNTPPNAPNPPADVNVQCAANVPPPVDLTASNNCDGGDITVSPSAVITPGNCNNQFTMVRTWTFIDGCGNQSSVSQTINVNDNTPPNAPNPPADVNLQCAANVPPPVDLTASNNCDGGDITVSPSAVITPGNCNNQFTMVRTWTFIDGCGNQSSVSQTIIVNDNSAPNAPNPPADVNVQCAADVPPPVDLTASDNCDGDITVSPSAVITPGNCANQFTMVRTWTFIDGCGNQSSVSQTINVNDNTPPLRPIRPADVNVQCAFDVPPPVNLTAQDNCDGAITVSPSAVITPGNCEDQFTMVRTWTFIDGCGNQSSVSQTINVEGGLQVTGFNLVYEGCSNNTIGTLSDGNEIVTDRNCEVNIQADVACPGCIGSVEFLLNGRRYQMENNPPYALAADNNAGCYNRLRLSPGNYHLQAIPYTGRNATGQPGISYELNFRVVNGSGNNNNNSTCLNPVTHNNNNVNSNNNNNNINSNNNNDNTNSNNNNNNTNSKQQ